ncbi:MAG: hypothetical protein R3B93_17430 [Bacteroidia bacterium]
MKRVAQILLIFLLFGFQEYQENIVVLEDGKHRIIYQKSELARITTIFPELLPEPYPLHPDVAYDNRGTDYVSSEKDMDIVMGFNSEAGQDKFYILYAYFLRQKNGNEADPKMRQNLIQIYRLINEINQSLYIGGTFYAHQYYRIYGYVEYAIYSMNQPNSQRSRSADIRGDKITFIGELREMVMEEITLDESISETQKLRKKETVEQMLTDLDQLITNRFLLKSAQEFQDRYY